MTLQVTIWLFFLAMSLKTVYHMFRLVHPLDPAPVPPGEIEDAVLVYTWREAFVLSAGRLKFNYFLLLVALFALAI